MLEDDIYINQSIKNNSKTNSKKQSFPNRIQNYLQSLFGCGIYNYNKRI